MTIIEKTGTPQGLPDNNKSNQANEMGPTFLANRSGNDIKNKNDSSQSSLENFKPNTESSPIQTKNDKDMDHDFSLIEKKNVNTEKVKLSITFLSELQPLGPSVNQVQDNTANNMAPPKKLS